MGDILCHTGDITFCARGGAATLQAFNEQIAKLPHTHKVVIAGDRAQSRTQPGLHHSTAHGGIKIWHSHDGCAPDLASVQVTMTNALNRWEGTRCARC